MFRKFRTVIAAAAFIVATYAAAAEMAGPHPDTYVVKRGDTLWDIADEELGDPTKREALKTDLAAAVGALFPEGVVKRVLLPQFVIQ